MSQWSLPILLESLHTDIEQKLTVVRRSFAHPGTKGDGSENVWIELLNAYLPERYQASKAHVVDSLGHFSDQMDIVIYDRQYSPFVFYYQEQIVIPAESVYAVFEAKQTLNLSMVKYAQDKIASVRKLHRTSLPIPYAKGVYPAKPLIPIIGGILTLESEWNPALGKPLLTQLNAHPTDGILNMGCTASHGYFYTDIGSSQYIIEEQSKAATAFLFKLIEMLQFSGTVPMIDIKAYANWLSK
jgi:hypothetical protein